MSKTENYRKLFAEVFSLPDAEIKDDLAYNSITTWDSVGHMMLMSALENEFGIMLEPDDIIDFSSFGKGKEILRKYGVELS